jgi:hypothetical protein
MHDLSAPSPQEMMLSAILKTIKQVRPSFNMHGTAGDFKEKALPAELSVSP